MKQGAEVVQRAVEKQQTAVERLVLYELCGVVEILVGIFDVPDERQVKFEIFVVDGYEFVVNLLGAVVRGANWKPVFFVWQEGKPNRLPEIVVLSFGICADILLRCRTVGRAVML